MGPPLATATVELVSRGPHQGTHVPKVKPSQPGGLKVAGDAVTCQSTSASGRAPPA